MDSAISNTVIARDTFGKFISEMQLAGEAMMKDMAEEGARLSREFAPVGHKYDSRTPSIQDSIVATSTATSAKWICGARHGLAQEFGGRPHEITGDVSFFWEREARDWRPGKNIISHPGNPSRPFLRPAYDIVMRNWSDYARRHYPR